MAMSTQNLAFILVGVVRLDALSPTQHVVRRYLRPQLGWLRFQRWRLHPFAGVVLRVGQEALACRGTSMPIKLESWLLEALRVTCLLQIGGRRLGLLLVVKSLVPCNMLSPVLEGLGWLLVSLQRVNAYQQVRMGH